MLKGTFLLDKERTIPDLPFSYLQNSIPIIFQFISPPNTFLIFFHELYINSFANIFQSLKAQNEETIFLENFFSKYQFLAALFSVVLSNYSFQHGCYRKLNFWCISDTFISKLREKIRFLYHRKYSIASILLKLSTLQRARKSNFELYFLHCRSSHLSQFLITDIITTKAIDRKSFWAHCNKLIQRQTSRRLHFFWNAWEIFIYFGMEMMKFFQLLKPTALLIL